MQACQKNQNLGPIRGYDLGLGHTIFAKRKYLSCGWSVEEAKILGCEFDILANHYVPKQCIDQHSINEYLQRDITWIGYNDKHWNKGLACIQAMGESDTCFTNQRNHIIHCAMLWKRQWRAFTENWRYFDAIIADKTRITVPTSL